jgi:quinoprotein glucose dehydrogenase
MPVRRTMLRAAAVLCLALPAHFSIAQEVIVGSRPQSVEDRFVPTVPDIRVDTWVDNLQGPWSLVFIDDMLALVSERSGNIRVIENGVLRPDPLACFDWAGKAHDTLVDCFGVAAQGEGGLMGLAIHRDDGASAPWLYVMHTHRRDRDGRRENRVVRLALRQGGAHFDREIISGIPGGRYHNGGRIAFGPDGMLYVATGEIFQKELAQRPESLGGKILRLTPQGNIPADNPIAGSPVYSLGHRNVQGLAWHPGTGDMFASEHGPSGEFGLSDFDEINQVRPGGNYGWPKAVGAAGRPDYHDPVASWPDINTPPAGLTFWRGDLMVAVLGFQAGKARSLLRLRLDNPDGRWRVNDIERWFADGRNSSIYGRLRDAVTGPDGALYVLTSNRDGRGDPRPGDDRILRIVMAP